MPQDPKLETMPPPGGDKMPQDPKLEPAGEAARCDQYAKTAISQNQQNISKGCGFTGPAWSDNYSHHYDWCMRVPSVQADAGTKMRSDDLQNKCRRIQ